MAAARTALLSRNLVFYLGSRFCSGTAMTMLRAAIAWHVYALTELGVPPRPDRPGAVPAGARR